MFTINDGYINALQEAIEPHNKFEDMKEIDFLDIDIGDIPDLYNCKYCRDFKDLVVCENCNNVVHKDEIGRGTKEVDVLSDFQHPQAIEPAYDTIRIECEFCPACEYGLEEDEEFEYRPLEICDLFENIDRLKGLDDYFGVEFVNAVRDFMNKQGDGGIITEAKNEANENDKDLDEQNEKSEPAIEKDDENYTKLKETVKKEMYKYLKSNGIDVEHLIKAGIELDTMKPILDKVLDTYVSTDVADYENEFNVGLAWDYVIDNNDIIITIENM